MATPSEPDGGLDESLAYIRKTLGALPLNVAIDRLERAIPIWTTEGMRWRVSAGRRVLAELRKERSRRVAAAAKEEHRYIVRLIAAADTLRHKEEAAILALKEGTRRKAIAERWLAQEASAQSAAKSPPRAARVPEELDRRPDLKLGAALLSRQRATVCFSGDRAAIALGDGCYRILPAPTNA